MKLDKITSIRLFAGHNSKLEKVAEFEGLDKSDILRKAVQVYLDQYESHPFSSSLT
ncbi:MULTISPECIES: hypothetical protein [unclassified Nostoc]|uniref:hypothetical protein n=1 Tax=unclassified Nostoc TaxID=2593658 RepID=UPI00167D89B6|nr:hypothetical protein [Nostoc sp. 'Peltigera membranacea cyanobiont' 213]